MTAGRSTERLRAAGDLLLATRVDLTAARSAFSWPTMTDRFCGATDWFDAVGRGNPRAALRIVEEDGSEQQLSYDDLVTRSDRPAGWRAEQGVSRGDRVLLMLGNQRELWESMLAVMKLGAAMLPTTDSRNLAEWRDDELGLR